MCAEGTLAKDVAVDEHLGRCIREPEQRLGIPAPCQPVWATPSNIFAEGTLSAYGA
jgi:hypothetical protein